MLYFPFPLPDSALVVPAHHALFSLSNKKQSKTIKAHLVNKFPLPQHKDEDPGGMKKLMKDMTALHAPVAPKKRPMVGELVKGGRKPKGSINVPLDPRKRVTTPRDPRLRSRQPQKSAAFVKATRLNKSRIFSLSSGDEVSILKLYYNTFLSCLLYTSPSPRDRQKSRMPSSA